MFKPTDYHMVKVSGKRAFEKGWPDNPLGVEDYNDWRAIEGNGLGVVCGGQGNIYVVDVDDMEAAVETLLGWSLPPTLLIETSKDKFHYIYRYTGSEKLRRKIKAYPGIDLLGIGGYIALHEPLKRYCVDQIAEMPQVLIDAWLAVQTTPSVNLTIVEGNRNDSLYRYGCGLAGQGMNREQVWKGINLENASYQPPLDMAEVRQIFSQVEKHIKDEQSTPEIEVFGHTAQELAALKLPEIKSICGPLMGGSITTLHGASGAGKSLFALHLGLRIAAGIDFEHWRVPEPKQVLYIDQENPSPYVQSRLEMLNTGDRFRIAHRAWLKEQGLRIDLSMPEHQVLILKHTPDVLILDSLLALNPPSESVNMNSAEWFERLMPLFDAITDKGGAVLILGNLNKRGEMYGTEAQRWRADRNWSADLWEQTDDRFTTGIYLDGSKERGLGEVPVKSNWRFSKQAGWLVS